MKLSCIKTGLYMFLQLDPPAVGSQIHWIVVPGLRRVKVCVIGVQPSLESHFIELCLWTKPVARRKL